MSHIVEIWSQHTHKRFDIYVVWNLNSDFDLIGKSNNLFDVNTFDSLDLALIAYFR